MAMKNPDFLKKACSFCIYQERTQAEAREKLRAWGADPAQSEEIIAWLITENFINESRYARQFAGGKFRVKKWGRKKIIHALKSKGITSACIREALDEIDEEAYRQTLKELALRKTESLKGENNPLVIRKKVGDYLLMKGYETEYLHDLFS